MSRHLQPVDSMFGPVVTEALKNTTLTGADAGAVLLAKRYAQAIDVADDRDAALAMFGPKLLQVLAELRCTPKARGAARPEPSKGGGALAKLRTARSA